MTDARMGQNLLKQKLDGFLEFKYDEHYVMRDQGEATDKRTFSGAAEMTILFKEDKSYF